MQLSISNIAWDKSQDGDIYNKMEQLGYAGLEIAPTRIIEEQPYNNLKTARRWASEIKEQHGFMVSSMQSIWYGRNEMLFGTEAEKKILLDYTKKAIEFAAEIGCKNLVFGCPRNRVKPDSVDESVAIEFFSEIGEFAFQKGTCIGMEANPPMYNTNYINTTREALELIKVVNSRGFLLNLDVGTMLCNNEDVSSLIGNEEYINHVHISEPGLNRIQNRECHEKLADWLKSFGYDNYVSIEMKKQDTVDSIYSCLEYVKSIFE